MGDRYTLSLPCAKCGETDTDMWYAPSSGFDTFKCEFCGTVNDIIIGFKSKVRNKETSQDQQETH